jgi:hypothetical protein
MPVEVRVGKQLVTVQMEGGKGSVALPRDASYTIDPHSKVLRRDVQIEQYQEFTKAKAAKAKAKAAS